MFTPINWAKFALLAQEGGPGGGGLGLWLPFLLVGLLYYVMVLRPEKQQRASHAELIDNLKKNDHVVTTGGIHGTVINAPQGAAEIVMRIDENTNTRIRVQRSSIARVVTESEKSEAT